MKTEKIYLTSNDLTAHANITEVLENGRILRLSSTIFHPQGGGQRADTGLIGGVGVTSVRHAKDGEVDHHMAASVEMTAGDKVELTVNPESRRINSLYHSGGHLIADAVQSIQNTLVAVQGHHWPDEARVEFEGAGQDQIDLVTVQSKLDELIAQEIPFSIVGDPNKSRALKIGTFSEVGCGGTHVTSSLDLKTLRVSKLKRKKGRLRISYTV